jgi:hypothetical protein
MKRASRHSGRWQRQGPQALVLLGAAMARRGVSANAGWPPAIQHRAAGVRRHDEGRLAGLVDHRVIVKAARRPCGAGDAGAPAPPTANDVCVVKLLVGPGNPAGSAIDRRASASKSGASQAKLEPPHSRDRGRGWAVASGGYHPALAGAGGAGAPVEPDDRRDGGAVGYDTGPSHLARVRSR